MNNQSDSTPLDTFFPFSVGKHESSHEETATQESVNKALELGYDVLTTPITTPDFHKLVWKQAKSYTDYMCENDYPSALPYPFIPLLSTADTLLTPAEHNTSLIGVTSPWIDLGSRDEAIAHISKRVFTLEVAYAAFCGVNSIIVHGPIEGSDVVTYARAILEGLRAGPYVQLHILMPMTGESEFDVADEFHLSVLALDTDGQLDTVDAEELFCSWENWNVIRTICDYSPRLDIALEVPRHLPSQRLQSRWLSEPIRFLAYPHTSFLRNAKQFPVLSKEQQHMISEYMRLRMPPSILICDIGSLDTPYPTPAEAAISTYDKGEHLQYFRHLQETQPPKSAIERFSAGYQDFLQSPLQPLSDNLESVTYEVFEKDPIKYEWYERAIAAALSDLSKNIHRPIQVAVVGAGRGPLVSRVLRASNGTAIPVSCWAVEKNPNAFIHLQQRNQTDPLWGGQVNVAKGDMRHWNAPGGVKMDILVSELLGSFADNELSPECLDGIQHVLHPEHGINIPQSYTAHLTPLASPRIFADLNSRTETSAEKWELPYVVMLQQCAFLSLEVDEDGLPLSNPPMPTMWEAWSFSHPAPAEVLKQASIRAGGLGDFGTSMGSDGYFETVLYACEDGSKTIELSTNPVTMKAKSEDMISWFPIFFPLKTPIYFPDNSVLEISLWRQTDDRKVWYEWQVEVFAEALGKRKRLYCSDLHSSYKNACEM